MITRECQASAPASGLQSHTSNIITAARGILASIATAFSQQIITTNTYNHPHIPFKMGKLRKTFPVFSSFSNLSIIDMSPCLASQPHSHGEGNGTWNQRAQYNTIHCWQEAALTTQIPDLILSMPISETALEDNKPRLCLFWISVYWKKITIY